MKLGRSTAEQVLCEKRQMLMLSSTDYLSCPMFPFRGLDAQRVYRLSDLNKALLIRPDVANYVAGGVKTAGKHYLVIELVRKVIKRVRPSTVPVADSGAEGLPIG